MRHLLSCLTALLWFVCAPVEARPAPALWGDLQSGPYAVGFKAVFVHDRSRSWRVTRTYDGRFTPDRQGKPVQIDIWYPARNSAAKTKAMTFGDYIAPAAPADFVALHDLMTQRSRSEATGAVSAAQLPQLLAQSMMASLNARPAAGRFPVVFYFGGLNAAIDSNSVLAEYLASHGYVFVAVSLVGVSDQQPFQSVSPDGLESSVRDMEYAASQMGRYAPVDMTRTAVMGHSIGGVEALVFAARQGNISAVIGLDGTYGFRGSTAILDGAYGYGPLKVRAAVLDLRRAAGQQGADLDLTAIDRLRYADRHLITLNHIHHSDFTSFAMVGQIYNTATDPSYAATGWNRDTGAAGFKLAAGIVGSFLDAHISGVTTGWTATTNNLPNAVRHIAPAAVPPTPAEMADYAVSHSLDDAKALILKACDKVSLAMCIDAGDYNSLGYSLLGQGRPKVALIIFQLAAWAYPAAANPQDSLTDAYLAVGDVAGAKKALQQAIELAARDSAIADADRAGFIANEEARLKSLP